MVDSTLEKDCILLTDTERSAVQTGVSPKEMLVERGVILLRSRHDVRLIGKRALVEMETNGEDILLLPQQTHEPRPGAVQIPLDGRNHGILGQLIAEPSVDPATERLDLFGR